MSLRGWWALVAAAGWCGAAVLVLPGIWVGHDVQFRIVGSYGTGRITEACQGLEGVVVLYMIL